MTLMSQVVIFWSPRGRKYFQCCCTRMSTHIIEYIAMPHRGPRTLHATHTRRKGQAEGPILSNASPMEPGGFSGMLAAGGFIHASNREQGAVLEWPGGSCTHARFRPQEKGAAGKSSNDWGRTLACLRPELACFSPQLQNSASHCSKCMEPQRAEVTCPRSFGSSVAEPRIAFQVLLRLSTGLHPLDQWYSTLFVP